MINAEQPFNSLQIIRPVIETEALKRFLQYVDDLAKTSFRGDSFVMLGIEGNDDNNMRISQVPVHDMYSSKHLSLSLLDRRTKRGQNQALYRAFTKLSAPEVTKINNKTSKIKHNSETLMPYKLMREAGLSHDITESSKLNLDFVAFTLVEDLSMPGAGYEVALVPATYQSETLLILDEARLCYEALASRFPAVAYPASKTSPKIPFMRTPAEFNSSQDLGVFMDQMHELLPVTIKLGEAKPTFNS